MEYAAILCQGNTREGYPIAAAALIEEEASGSNLSLSVCLGSSTDGLVIDVCLARLVRTIFPGAAAAGASIYIPGAREPCGGVAGDPAELEHSAQDNVFTLTNGLVGFAFPGQFSVIGAFSQDEICTLIRETKAQFRGEKATRPQLEAFLKVMRGYGRATLFVSDGSGGSCGCVAVSDGKAWNEAWLAGTEGERTHGEN